MPDNLPDWGSSTLSESLRFAEYTVRASDLHMPDVFAVFQRFDNPLSEVQQASEIDGHWLPGTNRRMVNRLSLPSKTSAIAATCAK